MADGIFVNSKTKKIIAADLFCGAGGSSTGLMNAVKSLGYDLDLLAVNHWDIAIATHSTNHQKVRHLCQSIDTINPEEVIEGKRLHLLLASPECTDHSNAKGGKPRSDQKRADAWLLMRWIEKLYVENLIIENVKEFVNWGPLNAKGMPDKRHRGKYFQQFLDALRINYRVEWKILNCADYGDVTSRERFFLIAKRNGKKITFPEPTHASRKEIEKAKTQPGLFSDKTTLKPWRPAKEIIDFSVSSQSIFNRPKPLSENTMRRIFAGFFKYSLKSFFLSNGKKADSYLINLKNKDRRDRSIDEPIFTQCGANHQYIAEPFVVQFFGEREGQMPRTSDLEKPLWTITGQGRMGLAEPFVINLSHTKNKDESMCRDLDHPLNTICGKAMLGLIEPFLVKFYGGQHSASINDPMPTITANYEHYGLAEPFIIPCNHGKGDERSYSIEEPLKAITQVDAWGLIQPYLVRFNNSQDGQSIDEPLGTLTTKDRYGLCIPQLNSVFDINFRMLQPHELGAATGFPKSYHFIGNRSQKVKQIGNAVPCKTAEALCRAVLGS